MGLIGSRAPLSLPFPIKGKGLFISLRMEHKLMIHFVVDILLADYTPSVQPLPILKRADAFAPKIISF